MATHSVSTPGIDRYDPTQWIGAGIASMVESADRHHPVISEELAHDSGQRPQPSPHQLSPVHHGNS